jgi:hypothetical protein
MSTICKLDPQVRHQRGMRAAFLRTSHGTNCARIMAMLRRTHRASNLTGAEKQKLFELGAHLMNQLKFQ